MAKTHTSSEVKARWNKKTYKAYQVNLRYDTDQHIIDFIEQHKNKYGTTNIFRDALDVYIRAQKSEV